MGIDKGFSFSDIATPCTGSKSLDSGSLAGSVAVSLGDILVIESACGGLGVTLARDGLGVAPLPTVSGIGACCFPSKTDAP